MNPNARPEVDSKGKYKTNLLPKRKRKKLMWQLKKKKNPKVLTVNFNGTGEDGKHTDSPKSKMHQWETRKGTRL